MDKFTLLSIKNGLTVCGSFATIEEAINSLQKEWLKEWVEGTIYIVENIPLKVVVG